MKIENPMLSMYYGDYEKREKEFEKLAGKELNRLNHATSFIKTSTKELNKTCQVPEMLRSMSRSQRADSEHERARRRFLEDVRQFLRTIDEHAMRPKKTKPNQSLRKLRETSNPAQEKGSEKR